MLNTLTLKNFRQHESRTIDFSQGINAIRGANEAGKSSILESVSYVLFGTRSLRTPLEQAVTWGEPVNSLKVSLTLTVDGTQYTITRSKGGAEVLVKDKVFVTGQEAVTSFASHLLGADSATASKLMMAGQNSIRGALEEGPKALSVLIEDLAGFSTFDQILEAAQVKLLLGSPAMFEERIAYAEKSLVTAQVDLPPTPDVVSHEKAICELQAKLSLTSESLPGLRAASEIATKVWQEASSLYLKRTALETTVERTKQTLDAAAEQVERLIPEATKVVSTGPVENLKQQIADAEQYEKRIAAYRLFKNLPEGNRWIGDRESFDAEVKANAETLVSLTSEYQRLEYEVKAQKAQRFDSDTCSKCGQKLPNAADIAKRNAEVDQALATLDSRMRELSAKYDIQEKEQGKFQVIAKFARQFNEVAKRIDPYIVWDISTCPSTVSWNGSVPEGEPPDIKGMHQRLANIEREVKALDAAKAKLELAQEQKSKADDAYLAAVKAVCEFEGPDADKVLALTEVKDRAVLTLQCAEGEVLLIKQEIEQRTKDFDAAKALWSMAQSRITDAERIIKESKSDLDSLAFNNALIKKLRAIRPIIASKLWNTVLASVSVMFSTMRKEESWITKEKIGFMVNGQAVESLSGSTLDILGLAIRCAMLRTFLPQCELLVLDEPMHGCDSDRSESMLGFLKSADFKQTLLVSHEEVSESVADNLIVL